MSDLTRFRDHCAAMATAEHKPECPSITAREPYWNSWHGIYDAAGSIQALGWNGPKPEWNPPMCDGCVTDADRALFRQLAGEVDHYLAPQVDLFGEETLEPATRSSADGSAVAS